jgi:methanogenic corrinoid protein MtbC1
MSELSEKQLILKQKHYRKEILRIIYRKLPILKKTYTTNQEKRALEDIGYHIDYLASSIVLNKPEMFAKYILWTMSVLETRGVPTSVLKITLESMKDFFSTKFDLELRSKINFYLDKGISSLDITYEKPKTFLNISGDLGKIAKTYLEYLLRGSSRKAKKLINTVIEDGMSITEVFDEILAKVQYEIGRLWETNQISVAREHLATQISKSILMDLKYMFEIPKSKNKKILATTIPGERHDFGIQMLTQIFELEGWKVYFLGSDTPIEDIIHMINEFEIDLLALSISLLSNLTTLKTYIEKIRSSKVKKIKIIVGGKALNEFPDIWEELDADGYTNTVSNAINLAETLSKNNE